MFKRSVVSVLLVLLALCLPGAASAAAGAIVFSEVTRHMPSGPDGEPMSRPTTGGLFAFRHGHVKQLTSDPADDEPWSSTDGSWIVFVRKGDVWAIRAGGSDLRQLTSGPERDSHPRVAPNGRYVLFERRVLDRRDHDLYIVDLQGNAVRPLAATSAEEREASFSPDGHQIVYARKDEGGKNDIWSIRPSGGEPRRLTHTSQANDFAPRFLGKTIVFCRGAKRRLSDSSAAVYSMDRRGGHLRELVARGRWVHLEDVNARARVVLFSRAGGLWVQPIGGRARRIVAFRRRTSTTGVFSPDGRRIAAAELTPDGESLMTLDAASGHRIHTVALALNLEGSENPSTLGQVFIWKPVPQQR
jgi:Tol biopolymer transport system component